LFIGRLVDKVRQIHTVLMQLLVQVLVYYLTCIEPIHYRHIDVQHNHVKVSLRVLFDQLDGLVSIFSSDDIENWFQLI
jgi:uncharacterized membrane protein